MTPERWQRIKPLLQSALERNPGRFDLSSLPAGATVGPYDDSSCAIRSFVLVLPCEPVNPITWQSGS